MADTELDEEQAHIDESYRCLDFMRNRAADLLEAAPDDPDLQAALTRRVNQLTDTGRALCFGRIDTEDGDVWHIGRRHVENEKADPVVVEWRAPVAIPFYRASLDDALGLERRRQFVVDNRTLISMADDLFGPNAPRLAAEGPQVRGRDALLAELERGRTGQMLDIVATIQGEQDVVIRAPQPGVLLVQGGPGTGKTAIGLHRAAFLLFGNDELARSGVLVVGPNRTFLRYIAQVLPSLGEEAVVQTTLVDLVPDVRVRTVDSLDAQRVKGDERMATVIANALVNRRRRLSTDIDVRVQYRHLVVTAERANEIVKEVASRRLPYSAGRATLRDLLQREFVNVHIAQVGRMAADANPAHRVVAQSNEFKNALDALWPSVKAATLVRDLLGSAARLHEAADGILNNEEQAAIVRRSGKTNRTEPWSEADAPLVDEATELIEGRLRTYGHAVVDEAQDLSPMQVRMLARRVPSGSLTILGDVAQGSGVWARDRWEDILPLLPTPDGWQLTELRLGYRAPGQVLEYASRLLPAIAPHLRPTESIRPGRSSPRTMATDDLVGAATAEASRLAAEGWSVAVICPTTLHDTLAAALAASSADTGDADRDGLDHRVTLVTAPMCKGLEFDAVVVVEPALIVEDAPVGLRLLYVALTRPTQHLSVVHERPLPDALLA